MKIIEQIRSRPALRAAVGDCSTFTQERFKQLEAFLDSADYKKIADEMRNNVSFHYSSPMTQQALDDLLKNNPDKSFKMSFGGRPEWCRYEVADWLVDKIVVRRILNIKDKDPQAAADEIILRLMDVRRAFGEFATSFIEKHTS